MTSAPLDLKALEAAEAKVSPAPWKSHYDGAIYRAATRGESVVFADGNRDDAAFLVALRNAAPALFELARDGVRWNKEGWQDIDVLREEATALRAENASLRAASREGTHALDCHLWGPRHYDCLMREYEASRAEIARLRAVLEAAASCMADGLEQAGEEEQDLNSPYCQRERLTIAKIRAALTSARSDASPLTEPQAGPHPPAP